LDAFAEAFAEVEPVDVDALVELGPAVFGVSTSLLSTSAATLLPLTFPTPDSFSSLLFLTAFLFSSSLSLRNFSNFFFSPSNSTTIRADKADDVTSPVKARPFDFWSASDAVAWSAYLFVK